MAPQSEAGGIDTAKIKEQALKDLCGILEGVRGKKTLVVEKSLGGPLSLIAKFSILQDYGVDSLFWLEDDQVDFQLQRNVIYLSRCTPRKVGLIASQLKRAPKTALGHDFEISVFFVPRRTLACDRIFEDEGVFGDVTIGELPLYFIPLEEDVLSLELSDSFQELYLHKDYTSIFYSAKALMQLQEMYGLFPRITGQGDKARSLVDTLLRMRSEKQVEDPVVLTPSSIIDNVIVIDRAADFVTPLLTQLTYEGLIDEVYGVENSHVELDSSLVASPGGVQGGTGSSSTGNISQQGGLGGTPQAKKRKVLLDGADNVFSSLRDANYSSIPQLLRKTAKRVEADFEKRKDAKTVTEMKQYVSKVLGPAQVDRNSLTMHANIAEQINKVVNSDLFSKALEVQQSLIAGYSPTAQHDNIEELIARGASVTSVLRLLCIYSCISTGFKPKEFDFFRKEVLQAYGYEHVLTLDALDKLKLFQSRTMAGSTGSIANRTNYDAVRKPMRLIYEEVNEAEPDDVAYVYSGYAPLSVRLVQCVIQKHVVAGAAKGVVGGVNTAATAGWKGFEDTLKYVGGKTFDEVQRGEDKAVRARMILNGQNEKKITIVFFLGGVTFTEIAALRYIAKQEEGRRDIIIATTSIISGDRLIRAAIADSSTG